MKKLITLSVFFISSFCAAQDSLAKYRNTGSNNPSIGNYGTWFGGDVSSMDTISWWRSSANTPIGRHDTLRPCMIFVSTTLPPTYDTIWCDPIEPSWDEGYGLDSIPLTYLVDTTAFFYLNKLDTIPVIMLIMDMQLINGKWDNKPYGLKGYRVNGDYETYYLDIGKKRLPKNIIVWLDQTAL